MTGIRLSDCACGRWAVDHIRPGGDPKLRLNKGGVGSAQPSKWPVIGCERSMARGRREALTRDAVTARFTECPIHVSLLFTSDDTRRGSKWCDTSRM